MNIFNSLGSNYDFDFVLRTLLSWGGNGRGKLKTLLEEKYGGKASLTYKGREAIELALKILKLPKDSWVAINGFTCYAVYEAIDNAGYGTEFIDIDESLNFSTENLKVILRSNSKVRVVVIQNTLGYPCDIKKIEKICRKNKLILIEDLAHSVGAIYEDGREAGTVGDFTVLSFSQDKIIDGISGGVLVVRNEKYQTALPRSFSNPKFIQQLKDRFYPLFTYLIRKTYSVGLGKLLHWVLRSFGLLSKPMDGEDGIKNLPSWYCQLAYSAFIDHVDNINHRRRIASVYAKAIDKKILSDQVVKKVDLSSNLRFPIFVENRSSLVNYLKDYGVYVSDVWYDAPISPKGYMERTSYNGQCPNAEKISEKILNLPTHINVNEMDAGNISELINKWLKQQN